MRPLFRKALLVTVPISTGIAGYTAGLYSSGSIDHSEERINEQFNRCKLIKQLSNDPHFEPVNGRNSLGELSRSQGGVSEKFKAFRSKDDPKHTVTFVYCGPKSVGFPWVVHGGVLGSLLRQSVGFALNGEGAGNLQIKYRSPTISGSLLKIETFEETDGLKLYLKYADLNKPLVEATYS